MGGCAQKLGFLWALAKCASGAWVLRTDVRFSIRCFQPSGASVLCDTAAVQFCVAAMDVAAGVVSCGGLCLLGAV